MFVEAYLASNLGLHSGSSALLSPTSPSTSSSVQDQLTPSRYPEDRDRDRASPANVPAAGNSSRSRDSGSTNSASAASSSSSSAGRRGDRFSRESADDKTSASSSSRIHSHSTVRPDGHGVSDKLSTAGHRDQETSGGSHRRASRVSPEREPDSARNRPPEIKKESDTEKAHKGVASKNSPPLSTETKVKDEKSDTGGKVSANSTDVAKSDTQKALDKNGDSTCSETEKPHGDEVSEKPAVKEGEKDKLKTERISPVGGDGKTAEAAGASADPDRSASCDQLPKNKDDVDDVAVAEGNDKKEQMDKSIGNSSRLSTDNSSVHSEPIDIRPQSEVKESTSPKKLTSEASGRRESSVSTADGGSPGGQKESGTVKQEKSPTGSAGSSAAPPAKVLTTTSSGVVYAMYPAAG